MLGRLGNDGHRLGIRIAPFISVAASGNETSLNLFSSRKPKDRQAMRIMERQNSIRTKSGGRKSKALGLNSDNSPAIVNVEEGSSIRGSKNESAETGILDLTQLMAQLL